jgi:hypothetical protein
MTAMDIGKIIYYEKAKEWVILNNGRDVGTISGCLPKRIARSEQIQDA